MSELLAKLTNLSYEFFGVILPGIIVTLFIILWWTALGPLAPRWTYGTVPQLTVDSARSMIDSLSIATGLGAGIPALAVAYFVGHILLWVARSGKADPAAANKPLRRVGLSLVFRIPKPSAPYDPKLRTLYNAVQAKFSVGAPLDWREFYPVVKSYLSQHLPYSLVATYQNKYTLHRSIATAAALLFWLNLIGLSGGAATCWINATAPRWGLLGVLLVAAIVLVVGFSSSYLYHWQMFGNTIITEAYSLIHGPNNDKRH